MLVVMLMLVLMVVVMLMLVLMLINVPVFCSIHSYLVRPSPFSAQKTFERHNSRRKSNISFCSNINLGATCGPQMPNMPNTAVGAGSRRGSGIAGLNPMQMQSVQTLAGYGSSQRCTPPMQQIKSNSLSLPDSPTVVGSQRGRSNSLRVGYYSLSLYRSIALSLSPTLSLCSSIYSYSLTHMFCFSIPPFPFPVSVHVDQHFESSFVLTKLYPTNAKLITVNVFGHRQSCHLYINVACRVWQL